LDALLFALLCLIWSTTWAAIRVCEQGFSPLWAAALRFALAALILAPMALKGGRANPRIAWWILPLAGLANALSYGLIFTAEREITGGTTAVLVATNPFFMLGAAVALGYERASVRKVVGLIVGFAGVFVMVGAGLSGGRTMATAMLQVLLAAAALWPTYTVLMRRAGDGGWKPLQIAARFILWTAVFQLSGAALIEGKPQVTLTWPAVGALVYLALVGTVLAWSLYTHLLSRLSMTVLSTMTFIQPAGALGIDWLLGERVPGHATQIGAGLILAGVILSAVGRQARKQPALAPLEA
jgi:drug/metabolite transporter (DMT)-like permease